MLEAEGRWAQRYGDLGGGLNQVLVTTDDGRRGTGIYELTGAHHHRYFPIPARRAPSRDWRSNPSPRTALQLTPDGGFDAARRQLDRLQRLGISHVYLSPVTEAVPGAPTATTSSTTRGCARSWVGSTA